MLSYYGVEPGMRVARKHLGWYSKGLPASAEFRSAIMAAPTVEEARELIRRFYEPLIERLAA
jgi:tRNA-dihydrouridine synthase B